MKKIHITEAQLNYIKKRLTEATLNGDESLVRTGDPKLAARETMANGKKDGIKTGGDSTTSVSFSDDALRKVGITTEGKTITKRQIKEAKIKKLQEDCTVYLKKNLK
jgi:hypothetical protein